jgi:hypothetical protein
VMDFERGHRQLQQAGVWAPSERGATRAHRASKISTIS